MLRTRILLAAIIVALLPLAAAQAAQPGGASPLSVKLAAAPAPAIAAPVAPALPAAAPPAPGAKPAPATPAAAVPSPARPAPDQPGPVPPGSVPPLQNLEPPNLLPVVPGPALPDGFELLPAGPPPWGALELLGEQVAPGEVRELALRSSESFAGVGVDIPVVVIRGEKPGPTLCLTAGVHGDELNGVEIVREILDSTRARGMAGTVVGIPIVNIHGFQTSSRYLPDRRDLNRAFPGHPRGSSASRIAHSLFEQVIRRCDALIDLHTGSFHRSNLPQIRADLTDERIVTLGKAFGATVIVHNRGGKGTLRRAAQDAGIPAIIYEAGEPMRFQRQEISRGVIGVRNVLGHMEMQKGGRVSLGEQRVFFETRWVRAERGGVLISDVRLGDSVREGDILGSVTDPIRKEKSVLVSPYRGRIIGLSLAPVMLPGYAAFHIGIPGNKPVDIEDPVEYDDRPE